MESSKVGIVIKGIPMYNNSGSTSSRSRRELHHYMIYVRMTDVTVEAAMRKMERKINLLMKVFDELDHEM